MRFLLDTDVVSELVARQPNQRVMDWVADKGEDLLYLSVITVGEIKRGIEKLPASSRKEKLADWLEQDLLGRFQGRLVPLDGVVLLRWGELTARLEISGKTTAAIDSLIAASSLAGDFVLATRNSADFVSAGVRTVNPWE